MTPAARVPAAAAETLRPAKPEVARLLLLLAAGAAPLTLARARLITRWSSDRLEDLLDQMVVEGVLVRGEEYDRYLKAAA